MSEDQKAGRGRPKLNVKACFLWLFEEHIGYLDDVAAHHNFNRSEAARAVIDEAIRQKILLPPGTDAGSAPVQQG